jgi:hypothetical protein
MIRRRTCARLFTLLARLTHPAKAPRKGALTRAAVFTIDSEHESAAEGGTRDRVRPAGALRGGACAALRQGSSLMPRTA